LPDIDGTNSYLSPEERKSSTVTQNVNIWSFACILYAVAVWAATDHDIRYCPKQRSQWGLPPTPTKCDFKHDEPESSIRERARNLKQDLLETFAEQPDSLTKSIAETVIAPMLEPPDKQPSWKWICDKAQTVLNDARDALNDYKKTVTKAAAPLLSFVRSKITSTCISSMRVRDGSRSDQTEIFVLDAENGPDGRVEDDACHTDVGIDPNISPDGSGYSYCLERYVRDNSDSRYLFPARGCNASKELNKIYLGNTIERFERMFIDAR
jgi:hypothetical protein